MKQEKITPMEHAELSEEYAQLTERLERAIELAKLPQKEAERAELQQQSSTSGFWDDSQKARIVMQRTAALDDAIRQWHSLSEEVRSGREMVDLAAHDAQIRRELTTT